MTRTIDLLTGGGPLWTAAAVALAAAVLVGMGILSVRSWRNRRGLPEGAGRVALARTSCLTLTSGLVIACAVCSLVTGVSLVRPLTLLLLLNVYQVWAYALGDAGFGALVNEVRQRAIYESQIKALSQRVGAASDGL